jgi:hypothetical protein
VTARLVLAAVAIAVVVALAVSRSHHDACEKARTEVFQIALRHRPAARQPEAIAQVRDECRGTTALVSVAGALLRERRNREALTIADEAVRREPESAQAWAAVEAAAVGQAPALARAADRRLRVLDPLSRESLNRSAGRSRR